MEIELIELVRELTKERKKLVFQSDGLPRPSINKPLVDKLEEISLKLIEIIERGQCSNEKIQS